MSDSTKSDARPRRTSGRLTLRDVAEHVGVSQISVSRYFQDPARLSAPLRERIADAVAELGYVPNLVAGGLASARSRVIGMVIPNISGPIFANTIQSFSDEVTAHGYQLLLASSYFSTDLEEDAVRGLLGWSPAALVLTSHFHSPGTEELIEQTQVPVLETWDFQPRRKPLQIGFVHQEAGRIAARHLVERGYRRIAFVLNSAAGDASARERCEGYTGIMREHGRQPIVFAPTEAQPMHAGREALLALCSARRTADAIIFANDNLAFGALLAAPGAGIRVPEQCAIVGFGDYPMAEMLTPGLTTVRPPAREIGITAAARIFQLLQEDPPAFDTLRKGQRPMSCELIIRASS
ncbi:MULTISPECIES: LacI family DNA-binding transcriptional regulator [Burkholderia]|uniref:LacI family DNA-binding transcriptional regulator n=1 Tax=Burkholderia TaxID=32008 RepID=UPI000B79E0B0|nr:MULTISPECIES: LacI family DNA-binding transcriptional regulator [Burkholderia]MBY4726449.1 LacI family DNA-binding transcriptional regulator [Burkholderia contaminans]MCI3974177.1 LacI family DNA-binding transcriptional regulator [Burkholderia sp. HI4860]MDN7792139.1 LacI family DNA-binding transcriptional regulator [Burkholderia contaminans]OXI93822.1 LacI family transcriptional regulator [Burkholderia sp. AU33647]